jgi:hypothetical protein
VKKFIVVPILLGMLAIAGPASARVSPLSMARAHSASNLEALAMWNPPHWSQGYDLAWNVDSNNCYRFGPYRIDCVVDVTMSDYAYDYQNNYGPYGYAYCVATIRSTKGWWGVDTNTVGRPRCGASA